MNGHDEPHVYPCGYCGGTGYRDGATIPCRPCGGTGELTDE